MTSPTPCTHCGSSVEPELAACSRCGTLIPAAAVARGSKKSGPPAPGHSEENGALGEPADGTTGAGQFANHETLDGTAGAGQFADHKTLDGTAGADHFADPETLDGAPEPPRRKPAQPSGPLEVGQPFGSRYQILKVLGVGGMGAVYQAWDQELGIAVALKVIRTEVTSPDMAEEMSARFKRELLLAREVTHKNVVRIHDLGDLEGMKYFTMSFVEGEDLASLMKREGKLSVARGLAIFRQVLDGMIAAHEKGIVHRDLKPANVMIDLEGEALLMDFGIARSSGPAAGPAQQMPGPEIALPERCQPSTHPELA